MLQRCRRVPYNVRESSLGRLAPRNLFFNLVLLADLFLQFSESWRAMRRLGKGGSAVQAVSRERVSKTAKENPGRRRVVVALLFSRMLLFRHFTKVNDAGATQDIAKGF